MVAVYVWQGGVWRCGVKNVLRMVLKFKTVCHIIASIQLCHTYTEVLVILRVNEEE